jgi:hypothetical protein
MNRLLTAALCAGLALSFTASAVAQGTTAETTPPKLGHEIIPSHESFPGNGFPIKVLLLKSWGVNTGWELLKTQWWNFGRAAITIDDSTFIDSDFTYTDLLNSGADVIVLSDPAGGNKQYSSDEIAAVAQYASAGHTVLGTFAVFGWGVTDNRGLMPVFGLNPALTYTATATISNSFVQDASQSCLFHNLTSPWQSSGWPYSQAPVSAQKWTHNALNRAFAVADSDSDVGIVSIYNGGNYAGIFISNYPEYLAGTNDMQLLYNAVTCFAHVK